MNVKKTDRLVQLDFFRSMAVILVVFYHYNIYVKIFPFYNIIIQNGGVIGVMMFFILSGYLMTTLYTQDNGTKSFKVVTMLSFYSARFLRIMPLFLFTTLSFYILRNHLFVYEQSRLDIPPSIFLIDFFTLNNDLFFLNPVIWTLKVEIIFYIIFPFIGMLIQTIHGNSNNIYSVCVPLAIIVLSIVSIYLHSTNLFFVNIGGLAMGVFLRLITVLLQKKYAFFKITDLVFILTFILLSAVVLFFLKTNNKDNFAYFGIIISFFSGIYFFLILNLQQNSLVVKHFFSLKVFKLIAYISYSIYLLHFNIYYNLIRPLMANVHFLGMKQNELVFSIISILLTVAASIVTYQVVEKRCSLLLKKVFSTH